MSRTDIEHIIVNQLIGYHPIQIGIFGSYARREERVTSDIDVLVRFRDPLSLLQLIRIENQLSETIGIKVDLITTNSIRNPRLKESIFKDLQIIYNA